MSKNRFLVHNLCMWIHNCYFVAEKQVIHVSIKSFLYNINNLKGFPCSMTYIKTFRGFLYLFKLYIITNLWVINYLMRKIFKSERHHFKWARLLSRRHFLARKYFFLKGSFFLCLFYPSLGCFYVNFVRYSQVLQNLTILYSFLLLLIYNAFYVLVKHCIKRMFHNMPS